MYTRDAALWESSKGFTRLLIKGIRVQYRRHMTLTSEQLGQIVLEFEEQVRPCTALGSSLWLKAAVTLDNTSADEEGPQREGHQPPHDTYKYGLACIAIQQICNV